MSYCTIMNRRLLTVFLIMVLQGCMTHSIQTATAPISRTAAERIVDGKSTRTDILSLFGQPNGYMLNSMAVAMSGFGMQQPMPMGSGAGRIMHYKDCIMTATAREELLSILPLARGSSIEVCKVLTVLLDDEDIVVAHAYLDDNIITKERISLIQSGVSTRKDVILALGGPTSVTGTRQGEIYMYKNCITKSAVRTFGGYNQKTRRSCQQAGILIGEDGVVQRVNFIPWDDSKL